MGLGPGGTIKVQKNGPDRTVLSIIVFLCQRDKFEGYSSIGLPAYQRGQMQERPLSAYAFLDPRCKYPLPASFDYSSYIETEQELWALFPETQGQRVNFCQLGLTANLYVEAPEDGSGMKPDETYFLMPFADRMMRPLRMKVVRKLTLGEYRMSHLTALRLSEQLDGTSEIMDEVHLKILGPEIIA